MKQYRKLFILLFCCWLLLPVRVDAEEERFMGHHWSDWIVEQEPSCINEGYMYRICDKYPEYIHREEAVIPATGEHHYELTETLPTCTEAGLRQYTCSVCGTSYREEIPALGHDYGDWEIVRTSDETQEGLMRRVCIHDASHIEEKTIPMLAKTATDIPVTPALEQSTPIVTPRESKALMDVGATPVINRMDIILTAIGGASTATMAWLLLRDYRVVWWDKRKKNKLKGGIFAHVIK